MSKQYAPMHPLTQNSSETLLQTITHSNCSCHRGCCRVPVNFRETVVPPPHLSSQQINGLQLNLFIKDLILSLPGCFSIPPSILDKWHVFRWQILHDLWFDWHRPVCLAQVPADMSVTAWLWQQEKLVLNKKNPSTHWHGESVLRPTTGFFRQQQEFTLISKWRAELLTLLLSDAVAEARIRQQPWKSRVKGQTGSKTRKHSGPDCWGGEPGRVCDRTAALTCHDSIKKGFPVVSEMNTDQDAAEGTGGAWETGGLH